MNKRGFEERTILWAFYSVLGIILLVIFLTYIKEAATGIGLKNEFLARDLALTLDTIYSSPNDISIDYELNDKIIEIKGNKIKVGGAIRLTEYSFANDAISNIDGVYKDKIIIKKENGKIMIEEFKK